MVRPSNVSAFGSVALMVFVVSPACSQMYGVGSLVNGGTPFYQIVGYQSASPSVKLLGNTHADIGDIAISNTGVIYGVVTSDPSSIYTIDATTGALQRLLIAGYASGQNGLAWGAGDVLYSFGFETPDVKRIDLQTFAVSTLTTLPAIGADLAWDPADGSVYAAALNNQLYKIDPISGVFSLRGVIDVGGAHTAIAIDPTGQMYATAGSDNSLVFRYYSVAKDTAETRFIADFSSVGVGSFGLGSFPGGPAAVPEPQMPVLLIGAALAGLGISRRMRRTIHHAITSAFNHVQDGRVRVVACRFRRLLAAWVVLLLATSAPRPASGQYLLVSSYRNSSVLRYDGKTGAFVDTFVPSGSGGLIDTGDQVVGPDGNLYVTDSGLAAGVLRYDGKTGAFLDEFIPDGRGGLKQSTYLVFGPDGNLYVSGYGSHDVVRFNGVSGAFIDALSPGTTDSFPQDLTFGPDGDLYVADERRILRFDPGTGAFLGVFIPSGSGGSTEPVGLTFGPDGNLYVADGRGAEGRVLRYSGTTGAFIDAFVPSGSGGLSGAHGIVFGPDGELYVSSNVTNVVLRYDGRTGAFIDAFVPPGSGGLDGPTGLTFYAPSASAVPEPGTLHILAACLCSAMVLLSWHRWVSLSTRCASRGLRKEATCELPLK